MTNREYTPGPWQMEVIKGGAFGTFLCITRGRGTDAILQIHWHNRPINEEDRANARLIAAAPELLTACKLLDSAYEAGEESGSVSWEDLDNAWEHARMAIAKANAA